MPNPAYGLNGIRVMELTACNKSFANSFYATFQNMRTALSGKSDYLVLVKTTVLFFSALATNFILHELSHAAAAYLLGIRSTLYQQYVNPDLSHATQLQSIIITGVAPIFNLCLGLLFWAHYKMNPTNKVRLFSLYAAIFGISFFLGNLFATAFGGDFHTVAIILQIGKTPQIILALIGLLSIAIFMYKVGRQFTSLQISSGGSKNKVIIYTILLPVILGTLLSILVYLPLPPNFIANRVLESLFWIFALINAFRLRKKESRSNKIVPPLGLPDIVLAAAIIILIRLMANGIEFDPTPY